MKSTGSVLLFLLGVLAVSLAKDPQKCMRECLEMSAVKNDQVPIKFEQIVKKNHPGPGCPPPEKIAAIEKETEELFRQEKLDGKYGEVRACLESKFKQGQ